MTRVLFPIEDPAELLEIVSKLSTCDRGRVAAVALITPHDDDDDDYVVGWSDSLTHSTCDNSGHVMENDHCVRTIHAEQAVVANAANIGVSLKEAAMYVNKLPCESCLRIMAAAGIATVYVVNYDHNESEKYNKRCCYARSLGIDLTTLSYK